MVGWIIYAVLFILVIGLIFYNRRVKGQLWREQTETARLHHQLEVTQRALHEANSRRKKLLAAATQALVIVERDYTISSANKVARHMFGKPDKNTTLMVWTRQHQLKEMVDQAFEGKKMPQLYFNLGERGLEARARAIKENGVVEAVALALHDVTELQRLSRARREFVANISHELRTPLASIQLLTETLLNGALNDHPLALELVNKIEAQVDLLNQLARELLDLSLIESGQMPLKMASWPLKDIVQPQINILLPQAERKNIAIALNMDNNVTVLADSTMIGRVITNLLHNAIKFTNSGSITLAACPAETQAPDVPPDKDPDVKWVVVSIADTGMGISPDELARIFERFYKVDPARSGTGTGMGLAIAKHIVEAHGGRIWAESNSAGSTFYFTLLAGEEA
jgi:two-component system, OmpR family, phosphate regulon sensor histidine kinase PhoR